MSKSTIKERVMISIMSATTLATGQGLFGNTAGTGSQNMPSHKGVQSKVLEVRIIVGFQAKVQVQSQSSAFNVTEPCSVYITCKFYICMWRTVGITSVFTHYICMQPTTNIYIICVHSM